MSINLHVGDGIGVQEWSELDGGQVENIDREIRRVVEAMRKEQQEQTTAQERGKKVCFTEEAQEAQEWQERFVEKRRRAQKARGEEWREREKRRCEEDEDERVPVVPSM